MTDIDANSVTHARHFSLGWSTPFFKLLCGVANRMKYGALLVNLPDGGQLRFLGDEERDVQAIINVADYAFARRTLLGGDSGFFESFADGQWDTPDLAQCLYVFARNADYIANSFVGVPFVQFAEKCHHWANKNTLSGSKKNIAAHYDLGNKFYEKWLDETMTYSSARFEASGADLAQAQRNKYRTLAQSIDLQPGDSVLEIGCGWGGFAEYAAKDIGASVTGLTLSKEQLNYARERIFKQGLSDRVKFQLVDYREAEGAYDKIASIEMFEAVGREYWPTYFEKVRERLKPGGQAGLQVITIADRMFDHYVNSVDFIQRYVFPGGVLPSPSVLREQIENAGLTWRGNSSFGTDYARTLAEWHERFTEKWQEIKTLGFDDRFNKLWRFYLAYCEAGFRAKTVDVCQVSLART